MVRARGRAVFAFVVYGALPWVDAYAQSAPAPLADGDVQVTAPPDDQYVDTDPSALTDFRPTLDPHGNWVDDPSYGTVWTPNPDEVGTEFQPYDTAGQWDYTGADYSWVSSFAWGWVCFHYGRWAWSAILGWMWIPGREYAPAWVAWRVGDDGYPYIGWAPTPPTWGWSGGGATPFTFSTQEPWTFTSRASVLSPSVAAHAIVGAQAAALVGHTKPYMPATPVVSGSPSYVPATPTVVSTPFNQPIQHGPPPSLLGIDAATVQRPAPSPRELRARQFARPSTAEPLGARAPTPHTVHIAPRVLVPRAGGEARAPSNGRGRH